MKRPVAGLEIEAGLADVPALARRFDLRGLVFRDAATERVVEMACQVARSDLPVLITGANGAALALLCAWAVPPLQAFQRGDADPDDDLIGAFVYGLVLGLRVLVIIAAAALFTVAVDPDALLRLFRRVSFRSALTAVLATRLVPVLAADGRRLAEAQRCRADGGGSRTAVVRAVATGALDRAVDVAATLEVRGFGMARKAPVGGQPWSRHDVAFLVSALAVLAIVIAGRAVGVAQAGYYPELHVDAGAATWASGAVLVVAALAPFADRRGVGA